MTGRLLALAAATAPAATRGQMVANAAAAGFGGVGLRLDRDPPDERELVDLAHQLDGKGLTVVDVEVVRIGNEDRDATARLIENAGVLGARSVLVVSDLADRAATIQRYGELCDLAAEVGARATLEFMPFTAVPDLAAAAEIVDAVGGTSSGIVVDVLHFARCGAGLDQLAALGPGTITHLQICDAPSDPPPGGTAALVEEARHRRLLPGTGDLRPEVVVRMVPAVPCSVEVQTDHARLRYQPSELARRAAAAGRATLAAADQPRSTGYDAQ